MSRARYTKPVSLRASFWTRASGVWPSAGASFSAALTGSLTRYGVALTSDAGSETASGLPLRSTIEPRSAGSSVLVTCWEVAAVASEEAFTPPSQRARAPAATSRIRNAAKRRPMRRSRSATSLASGGGRDGRLRRCGLLLHRRRRGRRGAWRGRRGRRRGGGGRRGRRRGGGGRRGRRRGGGGRRRSGRRGRRGRGLGGRGRGRGHRPPHRADPPRGGRGARRARVEVVDAPGRRLDHPERLRRVGDPL